MKLDKKWQCCGHKPIGYKRLPWPAPLNDSACNRSLMLYLCMRCNREYDLLGAQMESRFWKKNAAGSYRRRWMLKFGDLGN